MNSLFLILLACVLAGSSAAPRADNTGNPRIGPTYPSIYLVGFEQSGANGGANGAAKLRIDSSRQTHSVELMKNKETRDWSKWITIDTFTAYNNEFVWYMPANLERQEFYSFRLIENKQAYYTRPMYLSSKGKWLDPEKQQNEIQRDTAARNTNNAIDNILAISMYIICGILLL